MFIIAGFTTPSASEVPDILYVGDDCDVANRIAEAAPHPRVAQLRNPQWQSLRHWSEEAAAAFEAARNSTPQKEDADAAQAVLSIVSGGAATPEAPTLPATPARETVAAEDTSSAATSEPAQPATDVVGSVHDAAPPAADEAAGGGDDADETPLIPGQPGGRKRR